MATKQRSEPQPAANPGGRPSALKTEHIAALHEIVTEHAQASLDEIADELDRRCGVRPAQRRSGVRSVHKGSYRSRRRDGCRRKPIGDPNATIARRRTAKKTFPSTAPT
jgi:transposase